MNIFELSSQQLGTLLAEAARLGALRAQMYFDPRHDYVSTKQAYKIYGKTYINSLVNDGAIKPVHYTGNSSNSTRYYSRCEIESIHSSRKIKCELIKKRAI